MDIRRQEGNPVAFGITRDHFGRVKAHWLGVEEAAIEGGGMITLEPKRLVGNQCKAGGMRFGEAIARKASQLLKDGPGSAFVDALARSTEQKALLHLLHGFG